MHSYGTVSYTHLDVYKRQGLTGYGADGDATVFDVEDPVKVECGANLPPSGWFLRELSHFVARAKENRPSERVPREQVLSVLGILEKIV